MTNKWPKQKIPDIKVNLLKRKEKFVPFMLYDVLSCVTPHPNYKTILKTIAKYLPKNQKSYVDGVGNLIIKVGQNYTTMFSCHIDMVFGVAYQDHLADSEDLSKASLDLFIATDQEHTKAGFIWAGVITDFKDDKHIYAPTTLGADDKAGIFIMLKFIQAKIPGLYIFHIGEEIGGIGSYDIAARKAPLVKGIKRAVAFDRMDYFDIINKQRGGVCCSLEFTNAFATQLNDLVITPNSFNARYKGAIGSFTDTANYTGLIPECTNLSVGYFNQHSSEECLDTLWLEKILTPALLKVDWEALPTVRSVTNKKSTPFAWNQNATGRIGKYVTYANIHYSTMDAELPPWGLKKGIINSCTDVGMRRLIKHYLDTEKLQYNIYQGILELLKENAELKQKKSNGVGNGAVVVISPLKPNPPLTPIIVSNQKKKQEEIFTLLKILTNRNFQIYKDNFNLYKPEIAGYVEMLEWAWKEAYFLEEAPENTLFHVCNVTKDILSEIVVVNTTLVGGIDDPLTNLSADDNQELQEVKAVVVRSVKFLKDNWFMLGYDNLSGVQSGFKRIFNKITTAS